MFDKLVESTKDKKQGRTGRILFMTGLIYGMLMVVIAVSTILGLNPGLAESYDVTLLAPPPPPGEQAPPEVRPQLKNVQATQSSNVVPTRIVEIARPEIFEKYAKPVPVVTGTGCPGCVAGGRDGGVIGSDGIGDAPEPPPTPKPRPTPEPTPEVKATPQLTHKVSEGVMQGLAIRKVSPPYPPIAKAARASGAVKIQIMISEEGRVMVADVLDGHPLLRQAALDAARQWVFKPTTLSNVPVKVQGVLTFNFALN